MEASGGSIAAVGTQIVEVFVTAIKGIAEGISTAVVDTFNTLYVTKDGSLTNLAIWGIVFGGVALASYCVRKLAAKRGARA